MFDITGVWAKLQRLPYIVIPAVLASVVIWVAAGISSANSSVLPEDITLVESRAEFPALAFEAPDGGQVALEMPSKKVTVLHFWASWCAPCIEELPALDRFAGRHADKLRIVAVSLDNAVSQHKAEAFYRMHGVQHLPLLFGSQAEHMNPAKLKGLPTSLFLVQGREAARADASLDWDDPAIAEFTDGLLQGK